MSKGILVVGSLNMDMSISLDSIPAVGETVLGNDLFYRTGGKGANQACAAGRLGAGTFTPEEVILEAKRRGLKALAITDHDTVDGIEAVSYTHLTISAFILTGSSVIKLPNLW